MHAPADVMDFHGAGRRVVRTAAASIADRASSVSRGRAAIVLLGWVLLCGASTVREVEISIRDRRVEGIEVDAEGLSLAERRPRFDDVARAAPGEIGGDEDAERGVVLGPGGARIGSMSGPSSKTRASPAPALRARPWAHGSSPRPTAKMRLASWRPATSFGRGS